MATGIRGRFSVVLFSRILGLAVLWLSPAMPGLAGSDKPGTSPWVKSAYLEWLEQRSMLHQSEQMSRKLGGSPQHWQHPFGKPQPKKAIRNASVWLLDYPGSVIPAPGKSVIGTWANEELWRTLADIGIQLLHTGPEKLSGGVAGKEFTPTTDGWFDRISLEIDPDLGTRDDYVRLVTTAKKFGGSIAADMVPLHTGTGPDFRLAQLAYKNYPGLYTMVEIPQKDWSVLPEVKGQWASAPVSKDAATTLTKKGYLPGLIDSADAVLNAKELSGWDASAAIQGVDGKTRRWVYLHYFKSGQPTLNWLDPTSGAQRIVAGDIVNTVHVLGAKVVRLDAVPFLGIEPKPGETKSLHYQHPLSVNGTNYLAFLTRKLGGWSFQELNVSLKELKPFLQNGPDLSYDFVTRAQTMHAILTRDAGLLRQAYRFLLDSEVSCSRLVHDLQNHDEITYQLVELDARKDELLDYGGQKIKGKDLREKVLDEMRQKAAGEAAPYTKLYRPTKDGVATTFAAFLAASVGVRDLDQITPEQTKQIRKGHLLLTMANAMQPGVFSLSSWDLVGALNIPEESVAPLMKTGDYRWINRGGVDLMGASPAAKKSAYGLPRAKTLYGPLPDQLKDPDSFASSLKKILAARKKHRVAEGELIAAPDPENPALCTLITRLPKGALAITVLNFGDSAAKETIRLASLDKGKLVKFADKQAVNAVTGAEEGNVTKGGVLVIDLPGWMGKTLIVSE